MICKICNSRVNNIFNHSVLNKYSVNYYHCPNCDFIQTDEPFWLKESYSDPINDEDTGLVERNILFARRSSMLIFNLFDKKGKFLDYAAGYGLFARLMRDMGFDFYSHDPFVKNLFSREFEYDPAQNQRFEALTTFECFEHFAQPLEEIEKLVAISDNIIFSTELFSGNPPGPDDWDYYSFSHGQHIAFYSLKTLQFIAKKYGFNLYSNNKSFHLFTRRETSNSLYKFLLKLSNLGFARLIKYFMGTKTFSDSRHIIDRKSRAL